MRAVFIAIFFTISIAVNAQENNSTLMGHITDKQSKVDVTEAKIMLYLNNELLYSGFSDSTGRYKIPLLTPGTYTVVISCNGYSEIRVNGVVCSANKITFFDSNLEKQINITPRKTKKRKK